MKRVLLLTFTVICSAIVANAQPVETPGAFTEGNLVIYRFNDGGSNSGLVPGYLDEITPAGVLVRSIALPVTADGANRGMMAGLFGQAREGLIDLSADGKYLTFFGVEGPAGGSAYASYPKVIARVSGNGEVNTTTAISNADVGNVGRQVTSKDGTGFYTVSGEGRVNYVPLGFNSGQAYGDFADAPLVGGTVSNFALKIFKGKLYVSGNSPSASTLAGSVGMLADNLPEPTVDRDPAYNANEFVLDGLDQPNDFVMFDTNGDDVPDLLYVLDVATNANSVIRKYSYGEIAPGFGSWSSLGSYTQGKFKDAKAITGRVVGNDAQLFIATAPSNGSPTIARVNDPLTGNMTGTSYNSTQTYTDINASKLVTTILYASLAYIPIKANVNFRGIAFAPKPFTLPVKLTSFTGKATNNAVELKWSTASEANNSHFEVFRSNGTADFQLVGKIEGNGTSNKVHNYSFTDQFPADGVNYYRLKQVDFDGSSEEPTTIAVNFGLNGKKMNGYFVTDTEIQLGVFSAINTEGQLKITDLSGKVVFETKINLRDSNNLMTVNVGNLAKGMYVLTVTAKGEANSIKVIK